MTTSKFLVVNPVELKPLPASPDGELTEKVHRKCNFCEKNVTFGVTGEVLKKLSGPDSVYCAFCLRNGFNTANVRNVLPFSLRGIFGHYFYELTVSQHKRLAVCEVEDFVECHRAVGLLNPTLKYDDETLVWFADFSRVGVGRKQIPFDEILKSVVNMLACCDLPGLVPEVSPAVLFDKYKEGMKSFYSKRKIPGKNRLLAPTLRECGAGGRSDKIHLFNRACLRLSL